MYKRDVINTCYAYVLCTKWSNIKKLPIIAFAAFLSDPIVLYTSNMYYGIIVIQYIKRWMKNYIALIWPLPPSMPVLRVNCKLWVVWYNLNAYCVSSM